MFQPASPAPWSSSEEVLRHFHITLPDDLCGLLKRVGAGYSTQQELLVFGSERSPRSLVEWNHAISHLGIYPKPQNGGPLWLAENCIGMQYGVRKEGDQWIYIAFDPHTFETYKLANDAATFMVILFSDSELVALAGEIYPIREALGALHSTQHYAPYVSPLLGGSMNPSNWSIAPARVHLVLCYEEFKALQRGA